VRVMGVDPGLTRCGVGIVEGSPGRPLALIDVTVVRTPHTDPLDARLTALDEALGLLVEQYQPEALAVERVFSQHNVRTVMGTAQAGAVAILAAGRRGIPVTLRTPSEVKAAITGSGRADKAQITAMITRLLRLSAPVKPADAADALALAITEIWRGGAEARIAAAMTSSSSQLPTAHRSRDGGNRRKGVEAVR
jgi:crossover junction endodeoxyribonuclease RuvC